MPCGGILLVHRGHTNAQTESQHCPHQGTRAIGETPPGTRGSRVTMDANTDTSTMIAMERENIHSTFGRPKIATVLYILDLILVRKSSFVVT